MFVYVNMRQTFAQAGRAKRFSDVQVIRFATFHPDGREEVPLLRLVENTP